jgi:hypothetical protein
MSENYSQYLKGFQELYGFDEPYFTKTNIQKLSIRIEENYKDYTAWFDEALRKSGYELMFLLFHGAFHGPVNLRHLEKCFPMFIPIWSGCRRSQGRRLSARSM